MNTGNGNDHGAKHSLQELKELIKLGSPEVGEELPDEPIANDCACPFSAYALAEEWSTLVTELLQDPVNVVTKLPARAHRVTYYAREMDKYCGLGGLLSPMTSSFGADSVRIVREGLDAELPGGHENIDNLSDAEIQKALKVVADRQLLANAMMMTDVRTIIRNCSRERPFGRE